MVELYSNMYEFPELHLEFAVPIVSSLMMKGKPVNAFLKNGKGMTGLQMLLFYNLIFRQEHFQKQTKDSFFKYNFKEPQHKRVNGLKFTDLTKDNAFLPTELVEY